MRWKHGRFYSGLARPAEASTRHAWGRAPQGLGSQNNVRPAVAILLCLLGACRHPPQAYLLKQQVLTPPPSKPEIKGARKHPIRKTGCDIDSESFAVAWHGNTARVTVRAQSYYAPPAEQQKQTGTQAVTIAESGPRVYVDSVGQLQQFRDALAAKEDAGCFRGEEGTHLRRAITEAFPFPPGIAVYLRFGAYTRTSFFDLTPEFLLRLVSPPVTKPDISLYAIVRVKGEDRMRIALISGEGKSLVVPEGAAYYRYFYRTGASAHNFLATILGAPDRKKLHEATDQFLSAPETFCEKPDPGVFCQSVNVGINAGFYVQINGKDGFARLGGTIAEAIEDTQTGLQVIGRRRTLPENVTVRRMFHGKLIPVKVDGPGSNILSLVAMPGDEITF